MRREEGERLEHLDPVRHELGVEGEADVADGGDAGQVHGHPRQEVGEVRPGGG